MYWIIKSYKYQEKLLKVSRKKIYFIKYNILCFWPFSMNVFFEWSDSTIVACILKIWKHIP